MTRLMTTVAAAALLALPAFAQSPTASDAPNANQGKPPSPAAESTQTSPGATSNPSDMTQKPATEPRGEASQAKAPGATTLSAADRSFVDAASSSGKAEIALSKLVLDKGRNPAVKDFAKSMVDDHGKANQTLGSLLERNKLEPAKDMLPEHKQAVQAMKGLSGPQLDRSYMAQQVTSHQKAVQLYTQQSQGGDDAGLKQFAAETLPVVQHHLQMAQKISADLSKVARPSAKPGDATLEQGSTDRDVGASEPTEGAKRKSAQRSDPESARTAELNRQQLRQIEGQARR